MELHLEDGTAAGTVTVQRQGGDTLFAVEARLPRGLWRIVACGTAGELPLGVTEGGEVTLRRCYSRSLTDRLGAVGSVQARRCADARMESEWQVCRSTEVSRLPPLPAGALRCVRKDGLLLALPWRQDGPFPWPELFCLARVGRMAERTWVFYALDSSGTPVLQEEN